MEYLVSMEDSGLRDKIFNVENPSSEQELENLANRFFDRKYTPLHLIVKDFGTRMVEPLLTSPKVNVSWTNTIMTLFLWHLTKLNGVQRNHVLRSVILSLQIFSKRQFAERNKND